MATILIPIAVGAATSILSYLLTPKPKAQSQSPDLRLPGSEYGRELPKLYGENKFAGNFIYPDTVEKAFRKQQKRVRQGGKGGGKTVKETYVYGDFMVAFCEGPCDLQKLTIQGKTFIGSGATESWEGAYWTWFSGTSTQSAWSVAQAKDGANATPAYRKIALGAVDDLPLADYSNTFPQVIHAVLRDQELGGNPTLGNVIQSICNRAGYSNSDIDVNELQSINIKGFNLRQNGNTYRSSLEDLMTIYQVFLAYDNGKIAFRKYDRGVETALNIPYSGLGAHDFGNELPNIIEKTIPYPVELPKKLYIEFYNPNKDYERDSAVETRVSAENENEQTFNTELVLTASEAKTQARKILDQAWIQSNVFKFYLPPRYLLENSLKVGSVVALPNSEKVQIRSIKIGVNYILECEAHLYDPASYNYSISVPEITREDNIYLDPTQSGPAQLYILDTNLINDSDVDQGVYICSNKDNVTVYVSSDGATYNPIELIENQNAIGTCSTVLGGSVSYNLVDKKNTLDVTLTSIISGGQLETVTDSEFYGLTNLAFVGRQINGKWQGEYIAFQNAQLIGANQYRLSTLIRGAKGTEDFINSHTTGETFILLNGSAASIYRMQGNISQMGATIYFKGLQADWEDFGTLTPATIISDGNSSKPYDPAVTASLRQDSNNGDLTITWNRRERKNASWGMYEIPLVEGSEVYSIDIYNGSSIVRTATTTSPAYTYTSANQVTDFGSNQSTLNVRIRQQGFTSGFWGYGVKRTLSIQSVL